MLAIVAGSKVSTKLTVLESLLAKVDQLIVGGGIANTFLAAAGFKVGKSLYEPDMLDMLQAAARAAQARGIEIPMPADVVVVARSFRPRPRPTSSRSAEVADDEMILDIGPDIGRAARGELMATAGTDRLERAGGRVRIRPVRRGHAQRSPMRSRAARRSRWRAAATRSRRSRKYGVEDGISYISTGGGAFLEFVEGKKLPAVEVLERTGRRDVSGRGCPRLGR